VRWNIILIISFLMVSGCSKEVEIKALSNEIDESKNQLTVKIETSHIKEKPSVLGEVIGTVHNGDVFTIYDLFVDQYYVWYKIKSSNGIKGYLANQLNGKWVEITYKDNYQPSEKLLIELLGDKRTILKLGEDYIEEGYQVNSKLKDSYLVNIAGEVNSLKPGISLIDYTVTNLEGIQTKNTREVIVYLEEEEKIQIDDYEITILKIEQTKELLTIRLEINNFSDLPLRSKGEMKIYTEDEYLPLSLVEEEEEIIIMNETSEIVEFNYYLEEPITYLYYFFPFKEKVLPIKVK
jgi:hypothetical protein